MMIGAIPVNHSSEGPDDNSKGTLELGTRYLLQLCDECRMYFVGDDLSRLTRLNF